MRAVAWLAATCLHREELMASMEPPNDEPIPGECIAGGEAGTVRWQGCIYRVEQVRIEDLLQWKRDNGLRLASHQPRWLQRRWPPAVMYKRI
jgi:hypothetical protein